MTAPDNACPVEQVEVRTCPDCTGAGDDGHGHACYTCDGQGGVVPFRPEPVLVLERDCPVTVEGSVYEGMEACIVRDGRTIAHVFRYRDALELADALARQRTLPPEQIAENAKCTLPPAAEAMERALRTMIYETTSLSPMEPDGSHWCKISHEALAAARAALPLTDAGDGGEKG